MEYTYSVILVVHKNTFLVVLIVHENTISVVLVAHEYTISVVLVVHKNTFSNVLVVHGKTSLSWLRPLFFLRRAFVYRLGLELDVRRNDLGCR